MITPEHRKELFSYSYLCAIAAQAGANLQLGAGFFDYGLDAAFKEVISRNQKERVVKKPSGIQFEVQVKCTENIRSLVKDENNLSYDLEVDNYNDLIVPSPTVPKILIVVGVPKESERLEIDLKNDCMTLRNLAYWVDLTGLPSSENKSTIAVKIPLENKFKPETVSKFFNCIREKEPLNA